ncbi:nitric oxide synthase oxygenase [Sorangium sp. So ce1036]|uniref:nitric oxide synthase oxygenase n=1 Tax=Sorangium sp. So ce1036 TaxID=3133328 RepID=UPI003F07D77E
MRFLKIVCSEPSNELASFLQALPIEPAEPAAALVLSVADLAYPTVAARTFVATAREVGASQLLWVAPYFPPSSRLGRQLLEAVALVRASFGKVTAVWHGALLSALHLVRDDIRLRRTLPLPLGDRALPWVAPADVARAALRAMETPGVEPPVVCGPEDRTGAQVASALSRAIRASLAGARFARRRFEELDRDRSQALSTDELLPYLTGLGFVSDEARAILAAADVNRDGTLDFEEFTAGVGERLDTLVQQLLREDPFAVRYVDAPADRVAEAMVQAGLRRAAAEALLEGWASLAGEGIPADARGAEEAWLGLPPASVEAWAERHALDFVSVHLLPGQGLLCRSEGTFDEGAGAPALSGKAAAISKVVDGKTGRILALFRALDGSGVAARWLDAPLADVRRVSCGDPEKRRALLLSNGEIAGLAVEGAWQGLPSAMRLLMARAPLPGWQLTAFRELGELTLERAAAVGEPGEVVCNCAGVTRGQIAGLIEAGCATPAELSERTRAGQICGGCAPAIDEMFGAPGLSQAEVKGARELCPGIFQLRLAPVGGAPAASVPGQHVLVQGYLDRRWVARAYTLSAPVRAGGDYELTVKREELGVFSRWLCERAAASLLRASSPRGGFVLPAPPVRRVVFLAGGIGVTPAMAMLRALDGERGPDARRFTLDWSAPRAAGFACFEDELRAIAGRTPGVAFRLRETRTQGRISREEVAERYPYEPGARALVCGPEGFMSAVREHLGAAGWPEDAIQRELFTSNVDPGGAIRPMPLRRGGGAVRAAGGVCPVEHGSYRLKPAAPEAVRTEAEAFLRQCYAELGVPSAFEERWQEVRASLDARGTYTHLVDELTYGARLAWRNSTRCIGRFFWSTLHVRDLRHLETEEEIFQALLEHLELATNGGDIRAMMTVFRPGEPRIRIWNGQLIRYAGYRLPDGGILGDPANVELTDQALALGWPGGERTRFDLLPLIVQIGDRPPRWFELPRERVLEVPIVHPRHGWFAELGLKWHALPAVSNMAFDVGGVQYTAAPFNGFYMGTEIGARNLSDEARYDQLPLIADRLGLDRSRSDTLWKDAALVELNAAVLHSFRQAKVRMMDHHTLSDYFKKFEEQERQCGRPVYADWIWIVPPMSASTMAVFHTDMENRILKPNYLYQDDPWKAPKGS